MFVSCSSVNWFTRRRFCCLFCSYKQWYQTILKALFKVPYWPPKVTLHRDCIQKCNKCDSHSNQEFSYSSCGHWEVWIYLISQLWVRNHDREPTVCIKVSLWNFLGVCQWNWVDHRIAQGVDVKGVCSGNVVEQVCASNLITSNLPWLGCGLKCVTKICIQCI